MQATRHRRRPRRPRLQPARARSSSAPPGLSPASRCSAGTRSSASRRAAARAGSRWRSPAWAAVGLLAESRGLIGVTETRAQLQATRADGPPRRSRSIRRLQVQPVAHASATALDAAGRVAGRRPTSSRHTARIADRADVRAVRDDRVRSRRHDIHVATGRRQPAVPAPPLVRAAAGDSRPPPPPSRDAGPPEPASWQDGHAGALR